MSKLILIKFINGDEAIAEVVNENASGMTIKRPMTLHVQQGPTGLTANYIPTMMMTHGEVFIPKTAIMAVGEPDLDYDTRYREVTSGISLATSLKG